MPGRSWGSLAGVVMGTSAQLSSLDVEPPVSQGRTARVYCAQGGAFCQWGLDGRREPPLFGSFAYNLASASG